MHVETLERYPSSSEDNDLIGFDRFTIIRMSQKLLPLCYNLFYPSPGSDV